MLNVGGRRSMLGDDAQCSMLGARCSPTPTALKATSTLMFGSLMGPSIQKCSSCLDRVSTLKENWNLRAVSFQHAGEDPAQLWSQLWSASKTFGWRSVFQKYDAKFKSTVPRATHNRHSEVEHAPDVNKVTVFTMDGNLFVSAWPSQVETKSCAGDVDNKSNKDNDTAEAHTRTQLLTQFFSYS